MKMQMIAADMMRRGGYQACVLYYVKFTLFMRLGPVSMWLFGMQKVDMSPL
jgi:hypothetical protein